MLSAMLFSASFALPLPPGMVINHLPAADRRYVGSPSLCRWGADLIACHDEFGPGSSEKKLGVTRLFLSSDQGTSWRPLAVIQGAFWSTLFVHQNSLYLLGTDREYGRLVIRRSGDGGRTWTEPKDKKTGLLRDDHEYHTAPMPILEKGGRLWRGIERRDPPTGWGANFKAGMMSAPVGADLLNAASWTMTNFLASRREWNQGDMEAWLEGNAVETLNGQIGLILRVHTLGMTEKAAILKVDQLEQKLSFDSAAGFVKLPGGAKKFTIRREEPNGAYWTLATFAEPVPGRRTPASFRNRLCLLRSDDLTNWEVRKTLLDHPDNVKHGFQYVDWLFDGDDIIAVCRTAYDDGFDGAHAAHDANYLTFHRFTDFKGTL